MNKYSELQLFIIDETPVVSSKLLYQIHNSLSEIFTPSQDIPFSGKLVVLYGDLYKLP